MRHPFGGETFQRYVGGKMKIGWFESCVEWKVGEGENIRFWEDGWLGDQFLVNLYPRWYLNSYQRLKVIGDMGEWVEGVWCWKLSWRREWFVWRGSWWIL